MILCFYNFNCKKAMYTLEFKQRAIELSVELDSLFHAAKEVNTSPENIRRWKKELIPENLHTRAQKTIKKRQLAFKQLRKELVGVTLERDILKKGSKYLFAGPQEKFEFIKRHLDYFPVRTMCKILGISRSGFYKWINRASSKRAQYNQVLIEQIKKIHYNNNKRYGSPRIARELKVSGFHASEKHVRKLMKITSLQSVFKRKFKTTTNSFHKYPIAENKLNRDFSASRENEVWVSDITYIKTAKRWLYLTAVIDLFDRRVIGWALSTSITAKNTSLRAFKMAITNRPIKNNLSLIFHSDRGVQYACEEFICELSKYKSISRSMSRKGNCWDNAVSESFFRTLKVELIYQNHYLNKKEAELSISEYIETFYNTKRRHSHLGNLTISEYCSKF